MSTNGLCPSGCYTGEVKRRRRRRLSCGGARKVVRSSLLHHHRQMYIRRRGSSILTPYRPEMLKNILFVVSALALARAQIPSLGWCPEYTPMANFDMGKFLGVWYEAERYFQLSEVVSRCVMANYTLGPDGKLRVSNEVTNRFTGIKRVLEGEIKQPSSKAEEGKLQVKYTTVPLTPETHYSVLETDYKNYSVLWSCTGIGPVHAQNAWLMTRMRRPSGEILQKAYGVLDKYKISKTFFVKTDQDDCAYLDKLPEPIKPTEKPAVAEVVAEAAPAAPAAPEVKTVFNLRSAIIPDAPAIIIETRKEEIAAAAAAAAAAEAAEAAEEEEEADSEVEPEAPAEILNAEPVVAAEEPEKALNSVEKSAEPPIAIVPASVPEVILKAADRAKEIVKEAAEPQLKNIEPSEKIDETPEKSVEQSPVAPEKPAKQFTEAFQQIQEAFNKPVQQFQEFIADPVNQIQSAFEGPIQQFQAVIANPAEQFQAVFQQKPEEPVEKPAEATKESPIEPAAVVAETQPEPIEQPESPKEEKNQDSDKKIES